MSQHKKLSFGDATELDIHVILHEEGSMIDGGAFVQILQYVLILFKIRINLDFTIFYKVQRIGRLVLCKNHRIFIIALWFKAKHKIEKHLIVMISQVLHSS